jgi:hypothetical protein
MRLRICIDPRCRTALARTNLGPRCWVHTPDLGATTQWDRLALVDRDVSSDAFLANIRGAYDLTPEERAILVEAP